MSPLAGKLIAIALIALVYYILKLMFKGVLRGEAGASMILVVVFSPAIAMIGIALLYFLVKALYYTSV